MTDDNVCKFCDRSFTKLSTLTSHVCEQKRRHQAKDDKWVQLGLQAYLKFFEYTQPTAKIKTYKEFTESPYYTAFVKFGRYLVNVKCINVSAFVEWVITKNKKLDKWATDSVYEEFLKYWLKHENHLDAINRTLETTRDWADTHSSVLNHYFLYAQPSRIVFDLTRGKISPWCLYCSESGQQFLSSLNDIEVKSVYEWIDPEFWGHKLTSNKIAQCETEAVMKELKF